jgi:hypothetical protein
MKDPKPGREPTPTKEPSVFYFVAAAVLLVTTTPAHAYIDAGTGSYMLQMSMAALMTAAFTLKIYWQKVKAVASAIFGRTKASAEG